MARKTNITLKLDADLLQRIKVLAAQRGTSISALLTKQLQEFVEGDDAYEEARKSAIKLMRESTALGFKKPKSRDELHER